MILGLLELYQTDFDNRWFMAAEELAVEMQKRFSDPSGGFFDTPEDGEMLLIRAKDLQDNATPSGNALACEAFLKLAAFTDKAEYREGSGQALRTITDSAMRYPMGFARWLSAADFAFDKGRQIAVVFNQRDETTQEILRFIQGAYRPNTIMAACAYPPPKNTPALFNGSPAQRR